MKDKRNIENKQTNKQTYAEHDNSKTTYKL
jgi:hypothetical protein